MNREPTEGTGQALPGRRQFLSALGTGAGLACAAGLPLPGLAADETAVLSKRVLLETLEAVGKPAQIVAHPDGTEVVVLPYGGRVLGLFAKDSNDNFYWTHPALRGGNGASLLRQLRLAQLGRRPHLAGAGGGCLSAGLSVA